MCSASQQAEYQQFIDENQFLSLTHFYQNLLKM